MEQFLQKIKEVQTTLKQLAIEGWLLYDFRRSNPLALSFLEIPPEKMLSRRFFYWIPQTGIPIKIVSQVEPNGLAHLPGETKVYHSWQQLEQFLKKILIDHPIIAMEYSPNNAIPVISKVDGGTIDWMRQLGAQVVSSAHLLQHYTSVWTDAQLQQHLAAAHVLDTTAAKTWAYIQQHLQMNQPITEYQVQQFMLECIESQECMTEYPPTCAVNQNSADPHYSPQKESSFPIKRGDLILIDLWCKKKTLDAVYADISRMGIAAAQASAEQETVFSVVKEARDVATQLIQDHYTQQRPIQGWQVDQACREVIIQKGYGAYFVHRTGHNIGTQVHGSGTNLDNLETHDERELLAGTCFSVEPGIYLPAKFGIRLEYDIYLDPQGTIKITGGIQEKFIYLFEN